MNTVKPCTITPPWNIQASYEAAIHENSANAPSPKPGHRQKRSVAKHTKFWAQGRTLRIAFLDGSEEFKERVKKAANEWLPYINIKFEFVDTLPAEIKIAPAEGYSSLIGTDALLYEGDDEATMLLSSDTSDDTFTSNVIHEFGHVLGAEHEHQHPDANIPWNKQNAYTYFSMHGFSQEDVDAQVFTKLDATEVNHSEYDTQSIMHYQIPSDITVGDFSVPFNQELSAGDKAFMSAIYPPE